MQGLLKLHTWLSPAFPTGAYTFSHGLEAAIADERIADRDSCEAWLVDVLEHGSGWNDAVIFAHAWRYTNRLDVSGIEELNALAIALQPSAERLFETHTQADAFLRAATAWPAALLVTLKDLTPSLSLPVVSGVLVATHNIPLAIAMAAMLQSVLSNLAWVAARLVPLGQSDVLSMVAKLEHRILSLTEKAGCATLDELGGCALLSDIASMQHERLVCRICQT